METLLYGLGLVLVPFIWVAVITGIISIVRDLNIDQTDNGGNAAGQMFSSKQINYQRLDAQKYTSTRAYKARRTSALQGAV